MAARSGRPRRRSGRASRSGADGSAMPASTGRRWTTCYLRLRQPGGRGQPQRGADVAAAGGSAGRACPAPRSTGSAARAWTRSAPPRAPSAPARRPDDRGRRREHDARALRHAARPTERFSRQAEIHDTTIGWRFVNPLMKAQYGVDSMPETAENVAAGLSGQPRGSGCLCAALASSARGRRRRAASSSARSRP